MDKKPLSPETLPRAELDQIQLERLQIMLNRAVRSVAFYKENFEKLGVRADRIRSLDDMRNLPFTTRHDLSAAYPYGFFAVPLRDIVRIHTIPGTEGMPVVTGYTKSDIRRWSELTARLLSSAGVTDHDCLLVALNYGLFPGGLGFHYGAEHLGASVVPSTEGIDLRKQLSVIRDYKASVLVCTPHHALRLCQNLAGAGLQTGDLPLKTALIGGEPWSEEDRQRIEGVLGLRAYDSYGPSEVMGPGVAGECEARSGLHVNEDQFLIEIVDPATGAPVSPGAEGEIVLTTLVREGFPLVRFRTGDRARLLTDPCSCGRTFVRMGRLTGRTDGLFAVRGVIFSAAKIGEVLRGAEKSPPVWQAVINRRDGIEEMDLLVGLSECLPYFDEVRRLELLREEIARHIHKELNLSVRVRFAEPPSFEMGADGKPVPIVDRRNAGRVA